MTCRTTASPLLRTARDIEKMKFFVRVKDIPAIVRLEREPDSADATREAMRALARQWKYLLTEGRNMPGSYAACMGIRDWIAREKRIYVRQMAARRAESSFGGLISTINQAAE